jgi:hypothetical protein
MHVLIGFALYFHYDEAGLTPVFAVFSGIVFLSLNQALQYNYLPQIKVVAWLTLISSIIFWFLSQIEENSNSMSIRLSYVLGFIDLVYVLYLLKILKKKH